MERKSVPILYLIVPCYNEQEVLEGTFAEFSEELDRLIVIGKISGSSRILYVNDGSSDDTWKIIKRLAEENEICLGISQSRNRGHQNAVLAGLMEAKDRCDITVSIDCDGQDDIHALERMIDSYMGGSEIVYGVRDNRDTDTFFKRFTANAYYKVLKLLGADIVDNHADYRLVSSRVLDEFEDFQEVNLFLRGLFPLVGFKSSSVYYARRKRESGSSHYPLGKMVHLAVDGITSLSTKPLRFIAAFGMIIAAVSFCGIIWSVLEFFLGNTVSGWSSIICIVCFFSGIQLICLGVIGIYIGKIYMETKRRPRYIISERTWDNYEDI